jgi:hypothetical protein
MLEEDRVAAIQEYTERVRKKQTDFITKYESSGKESDASRREWSKAFYELMEHFWSEPSHTRLIDAEMVRSCFACAAEEVLKGNMKLSERFSFLGNYLATWFKLGKDTFLNELRGVNAESPNIKTMLDLQASMLKMETNRGLIIFLAKQIPCSCLDEDKNNAKQAPKTGKCSYCNNEDLKVELKKCSQCKLREYCSKKCQLKDWRGGHKHGCKGLKQAREQKAALKAQSH